MFRKLLISSILFSMCLFIIAIDHNEEAFLNAISITTVTNENKELFEQIESAEYLTLHKNPKGLLHYAIGARRASDRLVASGGQNQSWPQPHNVQILLSYPPQGIGANVSYVAVVVEQTSNLGQAYVVKGGINQRQISVAIEAYNTRVFNVVAYVYGV